MKREVIQTGEILQLPLTCKFETRPKLMADYGPSIPLGPDWTYGGITSPAAEESTISPPLATTTIDPIGEVSSVASASAEPSLPAEPSSSPVAATMSQSPVSEAILNPLQTGAGPLEAAPTSASVTQSLSSPLVIGLSTNSPSATSSDAIETTQSTPQPTQSTQSSSNKLLPLLPAILVPLLVAALLLLLLIYCFRRRERSKAGYTTAIGASSGGFGGWLTSSFARRANGSGEVFTSAWTQVPEVKPEVSPISPVSAEAWNKSQDRSALLGFIPNHHRTSSSIDVARPIEAVPAQSIVVAASEEELEVMADRNQSLLRRLNLGLGWLSAASLVSSKGSGSKSRIASGFTLEKGNGGTGALGVPEETESEKTESADKSGTASGTKETTSGSASASAAALSNEQLFYRPPQDSISSRGSTSSRGSPRKGFFSRFKTETSSKKSKRSSGPSRKSWISYDVVPEGEEGEPLKDG